MGIDGGSLGRFFPADSELTRRVRELDWAATVRGAPDECPEPRKRSVSLCLSERFPIVMYWGPERAMLRIGARRSRRQSAPRRSCTSRWLWGMRCRIVSRAPEEDRHADRRRRRLSGQALCCSRAVREDRSPGAAQTC